MRSLAENIPKSLPRPIEDLQIILVKESRLSGKKREYKVSGTKIRRALEWLIKNCPDYKDITIDEDNLAEYPEETGDIDIPTCTDEDETQDAKETSKEGDEGKEKKSTIQPEIEDYVQEEAAFDNDSPELREAYEKYEEERGDIPKTTHIAMENIATDTVKNLTKKVLMR